ncbi:MAG: HAD-IIIA family hydrolase [Proteobacteria bacterium]|nr:HAD-IIIA family hydrolase [Pseudomonadota bacterium]
MKRFVLLDRDGTINEERDYLSDANEVKLLPKAAVGLRRIQEIGLGLAVVTNQSGVGRGYFNLNDLENIHGRLSELLEAEGVELNGIYFCPHLPDDKCQCRKPRTGLIEQAAKELGFDPTGSFVIGDKVCDIDLGRGVGATTILVRTGYGAEQESDSSMAPDYIVDDLAQAAEIIDILLKKEAMHAIH